MLSLEASALLALAVAFAMRGLCAHIDALPVYRSGGGGTGQQQGCGGDDHCFHCGFLRMEIKGAQGPDTALMNTEEVQSRTDAIHVRKYRKAPCPGLHAQTPQENRPSLAAIRLQG